MTRHFNPRVALCGLSLVLFALLVLHGLIADHRGRADETSHAACCEAAAKWQHDDLMRRNR